VGDTLNNVSLSHNDCIQFHQLRQTDKRKLKSDGRQLNVKRCTSFICHSETAKIGSFSNHYNANQSYYRTATLGSFSNHDTNHLSWRRKQDLIDPEIFIDHGDTQIIIKMRRLKTQNDHILLLNCLYIFLIVLNECCSKKR
jgi:hypothetical protein